MGKSLGRRFRRPMARYLHHIEVFLSNKMAFHPQSEFIATRGGEDQRGDVDAEIGNLQAVPNDNIGEGCAAHQLFSIEVHQVDIKVIGAFGIREAKIQPHLLMLKRKNDGLEMGEDADQAFLFCQTVFDNLITDQEGLDARFCDIGHRGYSIKDPINRKRVLAFPATSGTPASRERASIERKSPRSPMLVCIFLAEGRKTVREFSAIFSRADVECGVREKSW